MANIDRAVTLLSGLGSVEAVSAAVSSRPWGYESDAEFLNVGVNLRTGLGPQELLCGLKNIEKEIAPGGEHRDASGGYIDREIDLDIIAMGALTVNLPGLQIPHPLMSQRDFVLKPMAELMPEWTHPLTGRTCQEMLTAL